MAVLVCSELPQYTVPYEAKLFATFKIACAEREN